MRVESDKPVGDGKGWIHRMIDALDIKAPPKKERAPHDVQHWTELADACFNANEAGAAREQAAKELGVSVESLERLGVGYGFDDYRKLTYTTWPERRQGGKVMGIIRRYRVPVSESGGNKMMMPGGRHGLYLPRDWWRGDGPILIPEGGSDTAALTTLGISAIGRASNIGDVNLLIGVLAASSQLHRPLIVIGERDRKDERVGKQSSCPSNCDGCAWCYPGRYGARVTAESLKASLPRSAQVHWKMVPVDSKDSREWVTKFSEPTAGKFLYRLVAR